MSQIICYECAHAKEGDPKPHKGCTNVGASGVKARSCECDCTYLATGSIVAGKDERVAPGS